MKLKPFDIDKALAGAKVVSREGVDVVWFDVRHHHVIGHDGREIAVLFLNGGTSGWTDKEGRFDHGQGETCLDLFLVAPEPKRLVSYHPVTSSGLVSRGYGAISQALAEGWGGAQVTAITLEEDERGLWKVVNAENVEVGR